MTERAVASASTAITQVMDACTGEKMLVVCDDARSEVGHAFARAGLEVGLYTRLITLKTLPDVFRTDVPDLVAEAIVTSKPDLIVTCLRGNAEETPFRIKLIHIATKDKNRRLGHGPGITMDMLTDGALALTAEEHRRMREAGERIVALTDGADTIRLAAQGGTDLELSIRGRGFFTDTRITNSKWGNLPTGEALVGPIENSLKGTLVCDVAVGGIGPIESPVKIHCDNGKAISAECDDSATLAMVRRALATDPMASYVGEMAIGLNPKARVVREFLESEKVLGTVHIAFGRNIDYPTGGRNSSANHIDFLVHRPTVTATFPDRRTQTILVDGRLSI